MRDHNVLLMMLSLVLAQGVTAVAATPDLWTRFRGPDGTGISTETKTPPTKWSETKNLAWKSPLPGAGSSSPILLDDRIFVTCFSGLNADESGEAGSLKRHLVCINSADGKIRWSKTFDAELPEDGYRGFITEHGYASNTPVTDGEHVFVFFGKSGVYAFDIDGNQKWHVDVGKESSNRRWGSAASLVLYKDTVIVNASEESQSIRALDKATGEEKWKAQAASLELAYGTPTIVSLGDEREELVIGVAGELWGLNPDNGRLLWFATTETGGSITPCVIADGETLFSFGGRPGGSVAIRAGGKGDVTESHAVWSTRNSSYVATPLLHEGHLYWIDDRGQAHCLNAETGESVYRERMPDVQGGGRPFYASPVLAGGKLYVVSRWNGTFLLSAQLQFEILGNNRFESDDSDFNATPAIRDGRIYLRSDKYLSCIAADESP